MSYKCLDKLFVFNCLLLYTFHCFYLLSCNHVIGLFSSALIQTVDIPDQIPFLVVEPGDNLTLTCPISGDKPGLFYWYKMKDGYMVQTVAAGTLYEISLTGQFNNSRFTVRKRDELYFLNIKNVSKEDKATYICQAGSAYSLNFMSGTILAVNGKVCSF